MGRTEAPLEGTRAIGRLEPAGPWIGFGYRAGAPRLLVGRSDEILDRAADRDLVLALAIAYFADACDDAPPELEATQSDLSRLVRHLLDGEAQPSIRAALLEAIDAIDDGLAGDAVAERLEAARSHRADAVDPVELLLRKVREVAAGR
jgi:hypothetical protein